MKVVGKLPTTTGWQPVLPGVVRERHNVVMNSTPCDEIAMPKAKTKAATANIYAVVGSDESEVKRAAAELAEKLMPPGAGDFGLEMIDGAADNAEQGSGADKIDNRGIANLAVSRRWKIGLAQEREFSGRFRPRRRAASVQAALEELSEVIGSDTSAPTSHS